LVGFRELGWVFRVERVDEVRMDVVGREGEAQKKRGDGRE